MYMNGRGPMMGGHRGPMMGAPMHHHRRMGGPGMGFGPGFRPMYRPMRMYHHRPMGFFPLGGLFILPALWQEWGLYILQPAADIVSFFISLHLSLILYEQF